MPASADEAHHRVGTMTTALRAAGLRLTHQRLEVVREIAASDEHPDVERVFGAVRRRVPTISLDTVYRTLASLTELGLIRRVTATPGPARYDANISQHHHFVCSRCGLIRDLVDARLGALPVPPSTIALGHVEAVEVQLRGVCNQCARKERGHA